MFNVDQNMLWCAARMFNDLLNLSAKSKHISSIAQIQDFLDFFQHTEVIFLQKLQAHRCLVEYTISC